MSNPAVPAAYSNTVRIGYVRVSGRTQDHQLQLDALAAADCRDVVVETASTRAERPKLRTTLATLKAGDTLVIYKPDRVARSMKELLVLLEDQLHAREVNLHILTGICAGLHRPTGATIAEDAVHGRRHGRRDGTRTHPGAHPRRPRGPRTRKAATGGRPAALDPDTLAVALARRARGESVTAIAAHLGIGRSTLYRALGEPP
jgi:DNA invertase Pin-like site-specific DNA recombinase